MKKTLLALSAATLFVTGCANTAVPNAATKADIDALRSDIASVRSVAQQAVQAAQQANLTAQDAKQTSLRTDAKLNNMFKKSQMK